MPGTNGHGPKRAVLYARVSTEEQARSGYSLAQQLEALRDYCEREGYEVIEEVVDPGQSGASLERPGMDRVRDLVSAGGVSVVLAQDRDRFAREPAYLYLLREEFAEHGTTLRALNDHGGDTPEGQLADGILDQIARFERLKTTERMRRGKLRRAREGKVIGNQKANLGFRYDEEREGLVVDEETMPIVRDIFRIIGAEGRPIYAAKKELERRGIITPYGRKSWSGSYIRKIVNSDVYRPHTYEEVKKLVSREVAATLEEDKRYGIWWWGRQRHTVKQASESTPEGRRYYKRKKTRWNPEEQWIAVPVPDSGIPREWIDAARERIKHNARPQSSGLRFYELAGMAYCGCCGRQMARTAAKNNAGTRFFYYRCMKRWSEGKEACANNRSHSAPKTEAYVWEKVRAYMMSPEMLRQDLERAIELRRTEMRGDPEREAKAWLEKLSQAEGMRAGYQEQAARGLMTLDELASRLKDLEEQRKTARRELEAARNRAGELEELERAKEEILERYEAISPEALDNLTREQRHHFYGVLRLKVWLRPDKAPELEFSGMPAEDFFVSNFETESGCRSLRTRGPPTKRPSRPRYRRSPAPPRKRAARRSPRPSSLPRAARSSCPPKPRNPLQRPRS
ncbi:site-specific DNA recombinase [Rubrobacter radiotolerans DSM 5868]|uniref:Recombinase family protein n=1 Tax=Rubrobacter radiotolerans TaxID=42256 RepID=A0AB35T5X8_RUBRA|nr:recombinase family protein [Rubrobacter radiotolerans]MDX5895279.1 recombinase family protein [Rubrobacter radiotolerans]SMC01960.1 site-specific DNA recombinase [Rubrobacter radiotolerans DSM 5868]